MAKELPYFKFEPGQWENGKIQICNHEAKGVFVDLCSMYWARLGNMPYALALQKVCKGDASCLQVLCDNEIIHIEDNEITIKFLDEQLNEFNEISEKRSKSAKKRWSDTSAMQLHTKSNAIREEKKREDKIREEDIRVVFPFDSKKFKDQWNIWKDYKSKEYKFRFKSVQSEQAQLTQLANLANGDEQKAIDIIHQSMANGWKGLFEIKKEDGKQQNSELRKMLRDYKSQFDL